jgi:hypothetical protein
MAWTPGARITRWLESPEGERWSRNNHRAAHAGESDLPNHIASVRPTPGRDPVWDRAPTGWPQGVRDPQQDPSGRPPLPQRTRGRSTR